MSTALTEARGSMSYAILECTACLSDSLQGPGYSPNSLLKGPQRSALKCWCLY